MHNVEARIQDAFRGRLVVERELGGGGMSRVFLAMDTGVQRRVVVKVLPPELSGGMNAERFRREIALSAQLQHPHIVPLLEVGQGEDFLCFTMPYVEGESLRARLERERGLSVAEAMRLWRELLDALSYAHGRGVVHRDIKPENVLLSGKHAVVTDFGVARALGSSTHDGARATSTGMSIGTPAYMAPEQAAGDPNLDHRVDLYAAGLVMWELLTGRHPFAGLSPQELVAAHVTRMPEPLVQARPAVPPALAALVERCLAKHPGDRPESADAVLAALEAMPVTDAGRVAPRPAEIPRRALVAAVVVVALAVGGWLAVRGRGIEAASATPLADARIADSLAEAARRGARTVGFLSSGGDPADEPLRRQAIGLVMSVFRRDSMFFLGGPEELPEILRVMRYPESVVTNPDTQAAMVKEGAHATVRLSLSRFGASFTVGLEVIRNNRSATIASFTADAADSTALPTALRQVADSGYAALKAAAPSLELPPSSRWGSPAAWTLLEQADGRNSERDYLGAAQLARAATRADSSMVRAWIQLSVYLGNSGLNRAERLDAISRARRLAPRASLEDEARLRVSYWQALNRPGEAIAAIDSLKQFYTRYSRIAPAANYENTSGLMRQSRREFAIAESHFRQGIAMRRPGAISFEHTNLINALLNQGKVAAADSVVAIVLVSGTPGQVRSAKNSRAAAVHDHEALARTALEELATDTTMTGRMVNLTALRNARIMQGRYREADSLLRVQEQAYARIGDHRAGLILSLTRTRLHAIMREDTAGARRILVEALEKYPPATMPFMDRPYELMILAHAALGDVSRANSIAAEWDRNVPAEYRSVDEEVIARALGDVELAEGRAQEALRRYQSRTLGSCFTCDMPDIAKAFHLLGKADSSIVYYERYVTMPNSGRTATDAFRLAEAYLRLGELYESTGDPRRAMAYYEDLVTLWKDADPEVQPAVAEVRSTIARLRAKVG